MNTKRLVIAHLVAGALMTGSAAATAGGTPDIWKEASISTAFTLNEHLDPFDIDVEVRGSTAFLQGTVESRIERDLAERIALNVDGVTAVDNNLRIDGNTNPADRDKFAQAVEDATITARIESQLLWNQATSALDVEVTTVNRIVTLEGSVRSEAEIALVSRIATDTSGVIDVVDRLRVEPAETTASTVKTLGNDLSKAASSVTQNAKDAWITTKVTSALLYNRQVDGADIEVTTSNGVVTLAGSVSHRAELERAMSIANGIAGVKDVRSVVAIEPTQS